MADCWRSTSLNSSPSPSPSHGPSRRPSATPVSRALFSDYYLTQRLPESPEWKNPAEAAAMTRAYRTLRDLYADVREAFANQPGTTTRANLLAPALQALGFTVEPTKADHHGAIEP